MAVTSASMADKIIVLDGDDEEESPQPSCSTSSFQPQAKQRVPTHITQSPFASAKKDAHVLQAENNRLFTEFVEHCTAQTQDCPEVLTYLQNKHAKASPDFLSSVEFRNTLGRCLTRAQANRSKTFVFINELCTVLKQHAAKKRLTITKVESGPCTSTSAFQSTSATLKSKDKVKAGMDDEGSSANQAAKDIEPSTSDLQQDRVHVQKEEEAEKKEKRASRKQIAYLENLLRLYNDEIHRLQQAELNLDDLASEESFYIQEHKLKRKMMKIYDKLCELKGCNTLTGRVIEQRIPYTGTRYPEINKKIERFINSPEARSNPPDYQDILKQVLHANERYKLCLNRKHLNQLAKEAFRDIGTRMQERRHLDLVYNFGSHLTDSYKPAADPALSDPSLLRKLKSNRKEAVCRLEEVISKYAIKQEDTEEQERTKRLAKNSKETAGPQSKKEEENKNVNGVNEAEGEDEEEDEEEDESSDPDIEEEIQASVQQDGPDDDEDANQEGDNNAADQLWTVTNTEDQKDEVTVSTHDREEDGSGMEEETIGLSPLSHGSGSQTPPLSDSRPQRHNLSNSESVQHQTPLSNGNLTETERPVDSPNHLSVVLISSSDATTVATDRASLPPTPVTIVEESDTMKSNGTSPPPSPKRNQKRKREERKSRSPQNKKHIIINDSEVDIPLDMGVFSCSSQEAESTRADTPPQEIVSSSQTTPPPKKNKVNVATQCDPLEVIVLSDSE